MTTIRMGKWRRTEGADIYLVRNLILKCKQQNQAIYITTNTQAIYITTNTHRSRSDEEGWRTRTRQRRERAAVGRGQGAGGGEVEMRRANLSRSSMR
jgi:hypothetical protein